jgi:hypothetical protein
MPLGHLIALISNAHLSKQNALTLTRREIILLFLGTVNTAYRKTSCIEIDPNGWLAVSEPTTPMQRTAPVGDRRQRIGAMRRDHVELCRLSTSRAYPFFTMSRLQPPPRLAAELLLFALGRFHHRLTPGVGGARRDRTDDLLLAKQALSQLSYGPSGSSVATLPGDLVGLERFELSTSRLSSARSNQLSYRPQDPTNGRPGKRAGCPSEERETKAAVSRKWSQRLASHLAPDVSKRRERPKP